jgi:cell division protein FtsB
MKLLIYRLKNWYEKRIIRERILFIILIMIVLYVLFYLLFFRGLTQVLLQKKEQIATYEQRLTQVNLQVEIFREWVKEADINRRLQDQYKKILQPSGVQLQGLVKTILEGNSQIAVSKIEHLPPTTYKMVLNEGVNNTIYQQPIRVVFTATYPLTVEYLHYLETHLNNIHWDTLRYTVKEYPTANIELELSLFYENKI